MDRKILILSSAIMVALILNIAVAPAMAKPNQTTVVVKDSYGKPYVGVYVFLNQPTGPYPGSYYSALTDTHGKAVFTNNANVFETGEPISVYVGSHDGAPPWGSFTLNRQFSARIIVSPPS